MIRCKETTFLIALTLTLFASRGFAHQANDSWLTFSVANGAVVGQWEIAASDVDVALGLDDNDDGAVSEEELQAHSDAVATFGLAHLQVRTDGTTRTVKVTGQHLQSKLNGAYIVLLFRVEGVAQPQNLEITCNLFFDLNPNFINRVALNYCGQQRAMNLTAEMPTHVFQLAAPRSLNQFFTFAREGVWHIWSGFDHVLFLLALLIPAVLWRNERDWRPVPEFRRALANVVKIVTAFTVAHSITLSLATLGIVQLPSRLTESAIAASVVIAAANNVFPIFSRREWMVAFGFGLIHGFGFASGLSDMGITRENLAVTVLGFNLGVEAGQLAIVSVFLPVAYALRASWVYPRIVVAGGSCAIVLVAAVWLMERAFALKLVPF